MALRNCNPANPANRHTCADCYTSNRTPNSDGNGNTCRYPGASTSCSRSSVHRLWRRSKWTRQNDQTEHLSCARSVTVVRRNREVHAVQHTAGMLRCWWPPAEKIATLHGNQATKSQSSLVYQVPIAIWYIYKKATQSCTHPNQSRWQIRGPLLWYLKLSHR